MKKSKLKCNKQYILYCSVCSYGNPCCSITPTEGQYPPWQVGHVAVGCGCTCVRACAYRLACVGQIWLMTYPFHSCVCLLMEVRPPKLSRDPFTVFYYALGTWHRRRLLYKYSWATAGPSVDNSKAWNNHTSLHPESSHMQGQLTPPVCSSTAVLHKIHSEESLLSPAQRRTNQEHSLSNKMPLVESSFHFVRGVGGNLICCFGLVEDRLEPAFSAAIGLLCQHAISNAWTMPVIILI